MKEEKTPLEGVLDDFAKKQEGLAEDIRKLITAVNGMQDKEKSGCDNPSGEDIRVLREQLFDDLAGKINNLERRVKGFLTEIPVRHHHHFDMRSKGFIIGGTTLLIATAISVGLCFGYFKENSRLRENDMKFRMIRQQAPVVATWADTTYRSNPDFAKQRTEDLEAKEATRNQAEAAAKQKEQDAKKARKEADRLKLK